MKIFTDYRFPASAVLIKVGATAKDGRKFKGKNGLVKMRACQVVVFTDARACSEALDDILFYGDVESGSWDTEYTIEPSGVSCRLRVEGVINGEPFVRVVGGIGVGDDPKNASSDAFKRACQELGLGRYLWHFPRDFWVPASVWNNKLTFLDKFKTRDYALFVLGYTQQEVTEAASESISERNRVEGIKTELLKRIGDKVRDAIIN